MFGVRVCTEMAFRQDKDPCGPVRLKLMKSSIYDCKSAPFSDSIHNVLEVGRTCDPYTVNVPQEVLHSTILGVAYFIYN
jgi:hypothetical protein